MRRIVLSTTIAVLAMVLSCASLWAQATAQISGTVKDQTGAVLPGVEVKATQTDTGIDRTTITQVDANAYGDRSSLTNYFSKAALVTPPQERTEMSVRTASSVGDSGIGVKRYRVSSRFAKIRRSSFAPRPSMSPTACAKETPGTTLSSTNTFGVINSSAVGPRIMQFALKYVF